jgi:protoporphyrinogen/coproporphyrinogen III oxidase
MRSIAVVGGGITGLTAAHSLRKAGHSVRVFEAGDRVGGIIRSERHHGFLVEFGPQALLEKTPEFAAFIDELGLGEERIYAGESARKRYIVKRGDLAALPSSLGTFVTSPVFSTRGKLRLFMEPFIAANQNGHEESVAGFVERRLGREILDFAVDPFVGGIFAGDPRELSVRHAFPGLAASERQHGSLFKGRIRQKKKNKTPGGPPRMFSFRGGLGALPRALERVLGEDIRLEARVTNLRQNGGWDVEWESGGQSHSERFDRVVVCTPAHRLPAIHGRDGRSLNLAPMATLPYAPVSVLALGFRREHVLHPLDGYGVLTPRLEKIPFLGASFVSSTFIERAPPDHVLLCVYVGGTRAPAFAGCALQELLASVLPSLNDLLGIISRPRFTHHVYWPHGIPQYNFGHGDLIEQLEAVETDLPGLFFAGNYRDGISVGECIQAGLKNARRAMETA